MPVFIARHNEIREERAREFDGQELLGNGKGEVVDLLGTIKVPRNLKLLSERLPKSNYGGHKRSESSTNVTESAASSVSYRSFEESGQSHLQNNNKLSRHNKGQQLLSVIVEEHH